MNRSATHHMYYVAIICPPEVDKEILQMKHWMRDRFGCIVALKSPAHITLIPPFWMEQDRELLLIQTLDSFTTTMTGVDIALNGFSHFGKKTLFVQVNDNPRLQELHRRINDHFLLYFGDVIKRDDRPFHPHITLATRDIKPSDFIQAWEFYVQKPFTASFTARTVNLLKLSPGKWNVLGKSL